ncbi:Ig-like domain-containing protein [Pseudomonas fluorescens]|uniref:Ig-like domain-containing protein n=1 Tax=Pseudomonas fluorescens TaxID=294 RepID=UPI001A9E3CA2|nr:Ig-like domain-containing protein [Pseudomonas fluorescens]QTD31473.1 Ig-like domain repeat protein [Pseudomonas fluorescens]
MSTFTIAVIDAKTITQTVEVAGAAGKPLRIKGIPDGKYLLGTGDKGGAPENVSVRRMGQDLHVSIEGAPLDPPQLIIEGFYDSPSQLLGLSEAGTYHEYVASDAEQQADAPFLMDGASSALVLDGHELGGFGDGLRVAEGVSWGKSALIGLGVLGTLGGLYAALHDHDRHHYHIAKAPPSPSLEGVEDSVGSVSGSVAQGAVTDDSQPTFSGQGHEPGNRIQIWDNGVKLGETVVQADGSWSFTPPAPLADGAHHISVTQTNEAGSSQPSEGFDFIVDTQAPQAPAIGSVVDDVGLQQGEVSSGAVTDDSRPVLSGRGEAGSIIEVYDNGQLLGTAVVDAQGQWQFTPTEALSDGQHSITARAVDTAGNASAMSAPYVIVVDTQAPTVATQQLSDNAGLILDPVTHGMVTDDDTPTFSGHTGEGEGAWVLILDKGVIVASVQVQADSSWSYTPNPALADGDYAFSTIVQDEAGNRSDESARIEFSVDTAKPDVATQQLSDNEGLILDPVTSGMVTDDATPTFSGDTGEGEGAWVFILDKGVVIASVQVQADGSWSYTPNPALADGDYAFSTIVQDAAGNRSDESARIEFSVDTAKPDVATQQLSDNEGLILDPVTSGMVTDDATPTFSGDTGEGEGAWVFILDKGVVIASVQVQADGSWSYTPKPALADGDYAFSTIVQDAAGNRSDESARIEFSVDTAKPDVATQQLSDSEGVILDPITNGMVTDDNMPTFSGDTQEGEGAWVFILDKGVVIASVQVQADGSWSYTPNPALADGDYAFSTIVQDAAGNRSDESARIEFSVDTARPDVATQQLSDNAGLILDPVTSGMVTDDATPTFSGDTGEGEGAWVFILDKGVVIASVQVQADGSWSYTPKPALADGDYAFSTIVQDAAGNRSDESARIEFSVDTAKPDVATQQLSDSEGVILDPITNGMVTDDNMPTFSGDTQEGEGAWVFILDKGVVIASVQVQADGSWSYTPNPALADGDYAFSTIVQDAAGNRSDESARIEFNVDTARPDVATQQLSDNAGLILDPVTSGMVTDDATPTFSGDTGEGEGAWVFILDKGVVIASVQVQADGSWSYTPNPALADDDYAFSTIVQDAAGNRSDESARIEFSVDTQAPAAQAVVVAMSKDSGAGDFVTGDGSAGRQITGTLTSALAADEKVQVSVDGGTTWLDVLLNDDVSWSVVDLLEHEQDWQIQTRVIDTAGNVNGASQQVILKDQAPAPATSLVWDGSDIKVSFAGAGLTAGSVVHLLVDGVPHTFELTQAQIDAGEASIPWSSADHGNAESIRAALIDQVGNVSSYLELNRGEIEVRLENFSSQSARRFVDGDSFTLEYFDLKVIDAGDPGSFYSGFGSQNQGGVSSPPTSMALEMAGRGALFQLDLKTSQPTNYISMKVGDLTGSESFVAIFLDGEGNEVYRAQLDYEGGLNKEIHCELPYGVVFSSMQFELTAIGGAYIWIDDISFGYRDYAANDKPQQPVGDQQVTAVGVYMGGDESDVFLVDKVEDIDVANSHLSGGGGIDTLKLTGAAQVLDLGALLGKLSSIEVVDLTGAGNNTLTLSVGDVLSNGETDLFYDSDRVQMMVNGNAGDTVQLKGLPGADDPGSWAAQGQVTSGGKVYEVYQHSGQAVELLVEQGVQATTL